MRKILIAILAGLLASACAPEPTDIVETKSALTTSACNPGGGFPGRSGEVTYSSGTCIRYTQAATPLLQQNYITPDASLGTIVSVRTASNAMIVVCDTASPRGFTQAPWAPCWSGGVNNGFQRVRGSWNSAIYAYGSSSATISGIVGRSFVLTLGTLSGPPLCNSMTALYPQQFGPARNGDDGTDSYTGSNDPANGTGSQVTAAWPDGATGSPCHANAFPSGYVEVYYQAFP